MTEADQVFLYVSSVINMVFNAASVVLIVIVYLMIRGSKRRFNAYMTYSERKTDEYLDIMQRVSELVKGRVNESDKSLEKVGQRLENKVVEASKGVTKEVLGAMTGTGATAVQLKQENQPL